MQKIEQAIRHALEKIDVSNAELREKIYQTAWYSHEKMLLADQQTSQEEKQEKRQQLTRLIQAIEAPYHQPQQMNAEASPVDVPAVEPDHVVGRAPIIADPPMIAAQPAPQHQRQRSWLRANALPITLIVILLVVLWSFYNSLVGADIPFLSRGITPSAAPPAAQSETTAVPPVREGEESTPSQQTTWIKIFDPIDMTVLAIQGAAKIELRDDDGEGRFIRVHTSEAQDAAILEIGEGVMTRVRGKTVIFDIAGRSSTADAAKLSLTCDFGNEANCGRRHFELLPVREDLLFRVDIPETTAPTGRIFITVDSLSENGGVDIFEVRLGINP